MTRLHIDPEDLSTLVNGLRVAADRFDEDAKVCDDVPGHERMAEQFRQQAKDSRAIADAVEAGDEDEEGVVHVVSPTSRRMIEQAQRQAATRSSALREYVLSSEDQ
jgi:hypothetical protein